jgi:catechol 2,3-dioxygenase-like lactoylglutathione lyase family enzyme
MFARINHMAMISPQYPLLERYYRSLFGFVNSKANDSEASTVVSDGNVGLNILPRRDGYVGGIDHFGMVVESMDQVEERMKKASAKAGVVKRPSTRPFAAYSGHDPDGNVFDLAEKNGENLKDVYAERDEEERDAMFHRFAIRTVNAEEAAEFYADVFELQLANRKEGDPNYHLTDGKVTLSLMPWKIEEFVGTSIKRPGPDHIGIKVKDLDHFKSEMKRIGEKNSFLASRPLGGSDEANRRRDFFARNATGKLQISDPDGNWLDVTDE